MTLYHAVILTSPEGNIKELAAKIQPLGVDTYLMPLIKTESVPIDPEKLEKTHTSDWLFITSKNAFRFFIAALKKNDTRFNNNIKIACIGEKTATYIKNSGYKTHFVSTGKTGEDLAEEFTAMNQSAQILFPRGNIANANVLQMISKKNNVIDIEVYKTIFILPDDRTSERINSKKYDFVIFTSPSAVDSFMEHFHFLPEKTVSIGPVTTNKLKEYNVIPVLEPRKPGYEEIAGELKYFYQNKKYQHAISRS